MPVNFVALAFDASDPALVAPFWAAALGRELAHEPDGGIVLLPSNDAEPRIEFYPAEDPKTGKNRLHLDLAPPVGVSQEAEVERLVALGAQRIDIGQGDVPWVVMADPGGNEFCVLTPR